MGYYPAAVIINDTGAHTGRFGKVVALQDSVIATIVSDTISGDLTALQFKSTAEIEGIITSITSSSGTVVAYRV